MAVYGGMDDGGSGTLRSSDGRTTKDSTALQDTPVLVVDDGRVTKLVRRLLVLAVGFQNSATGADLGFMRPARTH
jgi:hypothetical protein